MMLATVRGAILAGVLLAGAGLRALDGLERAGCDPRDPGNACPGPKCLCVDAALEVVFRSGGDERGPVLEIPTFVAGVAVETAVVLDIGTPGLHGLSFGVRHDPEVLEIVSLYPPINWFSPWLPCVIAAGGPHEAPGGYILAAILDLTKPCEVPAGRYQVCTATYRILRDPGPEGTRIEITDELRSPGSPAAEINLTVDGRSRSPLRLADAVLRVAAPFRRGDANADGSVNLSDPIRILAHLFGGGAAPPCKQAADANADGALDISDAVGLLMHLFAAAGPLPEPFGECGSDPAPRVLSCASFPACA